MSDLFRGTTALITGASRGIGAAFADLLAQRGANLVLVARHADSLNPVAERARSRGVRVTVVPADLARPEAPDAIADATAREGLTVDHLINNAGLGGSGKFQDLPIAEQLPTIDVNVRALTALAGLFLPGMLQRSRGGLINIASTSAFQGLQWLIADRELDLHAARLLILDAAAKKDRGEPFAKEASMAKLFASEAAHRCTDAAIQIHGGAGYCRDFPVERYARDARITRIYEGTSEIQRLIIARETLRQLG